ncbi:hypothetical protein MKW94_026761 [Papaver nudicaule]|uniref:Peptidase A1 domain-containing protein n=1 Tax=Papaver nudicaule TaxID=74823 RepID=A0AA41VZL4_PAPNU|nr:hypothetical protein [Papaver nudicaule]
MALLICSLWLILLSPIAFVSSDHHYLTLERILIHNPGLTELKNRDKLRHDRILEQQQSSIGVVNFPVHGSADPLTLGLYFARLKLGSPPKEFNVVIDTGSDILWVSCSSCSGCQKRSVLGVRFFFFSNVLNLILRIRFLKYCVFLDFQIDLQFFDPSSSSSASTISCSDGLCSSIVHTGCSQNTQCSYEIEYADGSQTAGFFVSDMLTLDTITATGNSMSNSSARVVFGCSNYQSGNLNKTDGPVGGILGLGQHGMSVIEQLSSRGISPKVFSHCLKGTDKGGGVLVFGEVVEEGIVYSPLVPSQSHYYLNLQSIAINGQPLPIDPTVFSTSSTRGTIVDSGTTLALLPEEAFDPFVSALVATVQQSVKPVLDDSGHQCFIIQTSVTEAFPPVMLNFAGGATMVLKPEDYLLLAPIPTYQGPISKWCVGFQKVQGRGLTILGELVLKDKIIIYDLARQRLGWKDYDCSKPVNVTLGSGNQSQKSGSSSLQDAINHSIPIVAAAAILLYLLLSH